MVITIVVDNPEVKLTRKVFTKFLCK